MAEADGAVVGFLAATAHGSCLHIDEVDVAREHQGKGIGRALIATALDWARAASLREATLTTFRNVPWNAPFYASLGFEELPPGALRAVLESEAARGLKDRCAMRLAL